MKQQLWLWSLSARALRGARVGRRRRSDLGIYGIPLTGECDPRPDEMSRTCAMSGAATSRFAVHGATLGAAGSRDDHDFRRERQMDGTHDDGAMRQLNAIQAGGHRLIAMSRQRIGATLDALDEGDFVDAANRLHDTLGLVGALANAQQNIAVADGSVLTPAADVRVGQVVTDVGEVTDVSVEDCPSPQCRRHITIKVGTDHELKFHGDQELFVQSGPPDAP